jgi:hypothetical protein
MKKILLGTTLLVGLGGQAFAQATNNSITIDDTSGHVGALSIAQDDGSVNTGANTNTVSGDGVSNSTNGFPVLGKWSTITINQTGGLNILKGTIKSTSGSTTAALNANYDSSAGTAGNVHSLTIGSGAAINPHVTVYAANTGSTTNNITDSINTTGTLTYNLGLSGTGETVGNSVSAGSGNVALNEGSGGYGLNSSTKGISGDGNTLANTLVSAGGAVTANLMMNGASNSLTNTVTTTGGVITLTQGGTGYGITGDGNGVTNLVGSVTPVNSFTNLLTVNGSGNTISNTVDGVGDYTVTQSLASSSSNNTITTSVTGAGTVGTTLTMTGSSYVDYSLTAAADDAIVNVALSDVTGSSGTHAIVTVEQTSSAPAAIAYLTVNGGGFTMGTLGSVPGTYSSSGAGVAVYQNSAGAQLNGVVTAAANGYTAIFKQ